MRCDLINYENRNHKSHSKPLCDDTKKWDPKPNYKAK